MFVSWQPRNHALKKREVSCTSQKAIGLTSLQVSVHELHSLPKRVQVGVMS